MKRSGIYEHGKMYGTNDLVIYVLFDTPLINDMQDHWDDNKQLEWTGLKKWIEINNGLEINTDRGG